MEISGEIIAKLQPKYGVSKAGNEWKMQEYVIEIHELSKEDVLRSLWCRKD